MFNINHLVAKTILTSLLIVSTHGFSYDLPNGNTPVLKQDENTLLLQKMSKGVATVAGAANKALVFVSVSKTIRGMPYGMLDPFDFFFGPGQGKQKPRKSPKQEGLGSGFFVDKEKGYIITNNHVIEGADEITLKLANGESYNGKVMGRDKNTDVAVVQITDKKFKREGIDALVLDNSENLTVGDFVLALGAPYGLEASISFGVVSALGRGNLQITQLGNFIQTDAAINPGNSGGPLIGMNGKVVGMNTAIYSRSGGYAGIGFAVPANLVRKIAERLINDGTIDRGYIGVGLQDLSEDLAESLNLPLKTTGTLVRQVVEDGPADKAGIEPGDVISSADGKDVSKMSDLINVVGLKKPGKKVKVKFYRDGVLKSTSVKIGSWAKMDPSAPSVKSSKGNVNQFGLSIVANTAKLRKKYGTRKKSGIFITIVKPDSPAERSGLKSGDLILTADGKRVKNVSSFEKLLKSKKRLLLRIQRDTDFFFVPLYR